jgi:hypothetical protein
MAASFTPYLGALGRIRENVVEYRYFANGLYPAIAPDALEGVLSPTLVLLLALVGFGWLERHRAPFDQALRYLMVLVCFSPSVANQYLAIPMAAAIALLNPFFALYVAVASLILLAHPEGLHWATLSGDLFPGGAADKDLHLVALACLGAGLAWLASGRDGRELGDLLRRALPRIGG